jgi:hypothetical protein
MTWGDWASKYHGYLRLPVGERREAVAELGADGFSKAQIADVLGVDPSTVARDRAAISSETHTGRGKAGGKAPRVSRETAQDAGLPTGKFLLSLDSGESSAVTLAYDACHFYCPHCTKPIGPGG